jgi:phytoene dehydrogenase-like protein
MMRQLMRNIDTAVVGGGLAGLTAAALLAKAGQRVALLEKSESLGGRAITLVKDGFHFNLGPHAWYAGGPGTAVLSQLGVELHGRAPKPAGAFALHGGRLHTLPIGFVSLLTTDLLGAHGKLEASRLLARLSRMDTSAFDEQALASWLHTEIGDPRARDVINMFIRVAMYANAPAIMSAGASLASFQSVLRHNVRYIDHGWQSIVDALRAAAVERGVQVIRSAPVVDVLHEREVRGVRLANGDEVASSNVVLAVPPEVAMKLTPGVPEMTKVRWRGVVSKAACLDIGLARLPRPANTVAFGVDQPLYYSVHSATARLAPANGAAIHVAKYLDATSDHDASADRHELETLLDVMQPGWRTEMVVERYLPAMTVTHWIPLASSGGLKGRPAGASRELPGLFLAGDWVGDEGHLASAAMASAARAARLVIERGQRQGRRQHAGAVA